MREQRTSCWAISGWALLTRASIKYRCRNATGTLLVSIYIYIDCLYIYVLRNTSLYYTNIQYGLLFVYYVFILLNPN